MSERYEQFRNADRFGIPFYVNEGPVSRAAIDRACQPLIEEAEVLMREAAVAAGLAQTPEHLSDSFKVKAYLATLHRWHVLFFAALRKVGGA